MIDDAPTDADGTTDVDGTADAANTDGLILLMDWYGADE